MSNIKKSELRAKLVKALEQLDNIDCPNDVKLLHNLDRGRVEYINYRVWDFDLSIDYNKEENTILFNYKGDEEPRYRP